jgi:LCP family protein required for cell wall assembly
MRPPRRRKPLWFRILGAALYTVFCLSVLLAGTAFGYLLANPFGRALLPSIIPGMHAKTPQELFGADTLTVLILGCDEDVSPGGKQVLKAQARSDMILLVKFDFKRHRVGGISIPRDLLWELPGYHKMKINGYHAKGGNDLAKAATEDVLGIKIDRVVSLNFDAFEDMVDTVGGVPMYVPIDMDYDDNAGNLHIHLKRGRQILNGYRAMCFVRMRHSDSDFMRQQRQKDFILAFKNTLAHQWLLLDPVARKAQEALGGAFSADELVSLATFTRNIAGAGMKMGMVPIIRGRQGTGYGYYVDLDRDKLPQALKEFHVTEDDGAKATENP